MGRQRHWGEIDICRGRLREKEGKRKKSGIDRETEVDIETYILV